MEQHGSYGAKFAVALALIAALVAAPRFAAANCNNPECTPRPDGSGCCRKSSCTWKNAGGSCRDEEDPCHTGNCQADGGGGFQCVQAVPGGNNAANGQKCVLSENVCLIGACHGGDCSGIGSAGSDEFIPRCPDTDGNPCTDHCVAPSNVFDRCDTFPGPSGGPCYALNGTTCTRGSCVAGACNLAGGAPLTCPAAPQCERITCDAFAGCSTEATPGVSCDSNPNDCTEWVCVQQADGDGICRATAQEAGEPCSPGDGNPCTIDQCNPSRDCNVNIPVPNTPVTDCTNTSPSPGPCQQDICYLGACTNLADPTKVGTTCDTDGNNCTDQQCTASGACAVSACHTGTSCALCGASGSCGYSGTVCTCVLP